MIGSSLSLCYPQIAVPDLLYHRALCFISPLTKHIRLVGLVAFSGTLRGSVSNGGKSIQKRDLKRALIQFM